jgi:hypothetical protein
MIVVVAKAAAHLVQPSEWQGQGQGQDQGQGQVQQNTMPFHSSHHLHAATWAIPIPNPLLI